MKRLSWGQAFGRESPSPASSSGGEAFGAKKSITYWGGICLLSNNLTGPGMVLLPGLFAGAGLAFPLLVTLLIAVLSSLSVLFVAKMIQSIPGNSGFSQRIEFSKLIRRLFPKWLYVCAFFAMIFNLQVCHFMLIPIHSLLIFSSHSNILATDIQFAGCERWSHHRVCADHGLHSPCHLQEDVCHDLVLLPL
jgi:hypothetical protein